MKKWELILWLQSQISACESRAKEFVDILDDKQSSERVMTKAEAFNEVIECLKANEYKSNNANTDRPD